MTESRGELVREHAKVGLSIFSLIQLSRQRSFVPLLLSSLRETAPEFLPDSFQVALFGDSSELRKGPQKPLTDQAIPEVFESLQSPRMGYVELTRGQPPVVTITLMNVHRMPPLRHDGMILVISRELAASHDGRQGVARVAKLIFQVCGGFFGDLGTMLLMKKGPLDPRGFRRAIPGNIEDGLPAPRWGLLFGPDYTMLLGSERLRHAPCEVVQEFGDRSFLLLLAEDFATLENDEVLLEEKRQALLEYLGPEYFRYVNANSPKKVLPQFLRR